MTVRFILGRSGTGKTRLCIDAIADALRDAAQSQTLIFLVPEQATYQAERALLEYPGISGFSRLHVLSFQRLTFMLLGRHTVGAELSEVGRELIIHRILRRLRGELKIFGNSAAHPGLAAKVARTIVEFHQYAHTPEEVEQLCTRLWANGPTLTALKFHDLARIYKEYVKSLDADFINADNQLSQACRVAANSDLLKGAWLWVDGFSGFTAQEFEMLKELFKVSEKATVALCADPARFDYESPCESSLDPISIFNPTERTYARLFEIARKNKITIDEPLILKKMRRFTAPALAHIEKELFADVPEQTITAGAVNIMASPNTRLEAQAVARQIRRLVNQRGMRYRDIAVVASDLDAYQHFIQAAFTDAKIPFFIDRAKPIIQHPAVELISCALQIAAGDFTSTDVIAYLKTDLATLTRDETDLLENYCVAFGVEKFHWTAPDDWQFGQQDKTCDVAAINSLRRKTFEPLTAFCKVLSEKEKFTAAEFRDAIFKFLDSIDFRSKLGAWIEKAAAEKNNSFADQHRQFLKLLVNLLNELVQIFGDEGLTLKEYANLLSRAFGQLTLGLIPPSLDQVLVGSIERSRHPDLKAIFLIGATQRQFPSPVRFDVVLTDSDRDLAQAQGCELADSGATQLTARQYLAYIAYTRPSELLYICYPLNDDSGSAIAVSPFVSAIQDLFTDLKVEYTAAGSDLSGIASNYDLAEILCARLGGDCDSADESEKQCLAAFVQLMGRDRAFENDKTLVTRALHYHNPSSVDSAFINSYFPEKISSSNSRISTFAACPFKFFANYLLRLRPREVFKLEAPDLGEFYHAALEKFFAGLRSGNVELASASDDQIAEILDAAIIEVLADPLFVSDYVTRSALNQFIIECGKNILLDCVRELAQGARAGIFTQIGCEMPFGFDKSPLNVFSIALDAKHTLLMRGKIDRIDVCKKDNCTAVVFDFKTSPKAADWSRIVTGLDMQLLVYLRAVAHGKVSGYGPLQPAGAFYFPIDPGSQRAELDDFESAGTKFKRKARGLADGTCIGHLDGAPGTHGSKFYNFYPSKADGVYGRYNQSGALRPEHFESLLKFVDFKLAQFGNQMLSGEFAVRPYRLKKETPCSYCDFKALCRFDWRINEYNFMQACDKETVLENIKELIDG